MKYTIHSWELGTFDIGENKFNKLKQAKNCLSAALAIVEKYELLLSNYLDLEKECLSVTTDYMVRTSTDYFKFFDIR